MSLLTQVMIMDTGLFAVQTRRYNYIYLPISKNICLSPLAFYFINFFNTIYIWLKTGSAVKPASPAITKAKWDCRPPAGPKQRTECCVPQTNPCQQRQCHRSSG